MKGKVIDSNFGLEVLYKDLKNFHKFFQVQLFQQSSLFTPPPSAQMPLSSSSGDPVEFDLKYPVNSSSPDPSTQQSLPTSPPAIIGDLKSRHMPPSKESFWRLYLPHRLPRFITIDTLDHFAVYFLRQIVAF